MLDDAKLMHALIWHFSSPLLCCALTCTAHKSLLAWPPWLECLIDCKGFNHGSSSSYSLHSFHAARFASIAVVTGI